ncbi:hypothetical protein [Caminibacter sp.]
MKKIILIFVFVIAYAGYEIKTLQELTSKILIAKKFNGKIDYITKFDVPFKYRNCEVLDYFMFDKRILVLRDNLARDFLIIDNKKIDIGNFIQGVQTKNRLYILSDEYLYIFDKNLNLISKKTVINPLGMFKKNYLYLATKSKIFLLNDKLIDATGNIEGVDFIKFFNVNDIKFFSHFVIYKSFIYEVFKDGYPYMLNDILNNITLGFNEKIKTAKYINGYLYVLAGNTLYKFNKDELLQTYEVKNLINFFKSGNDILLYFPQKIALLKDTFSIKGFSKCARVDGYKLAKFNKNIVVISQKEGFYISLFDKYLNLIVSKKIDAKINSLKQAGKYLYACGIKRGRFWIGKFDKNLKLIKENSVFKAGQCFDFVLDDNRIVGVGYKIFDFLGDDVKRMDIAFFDKNLNLIDDKTYGNTRGSIKKIINGSYFFALAKFDKYYLFEIFYKNGFLKDYKKMGKFKKIYDFKKIGDGFIFSNDKGIYELKDKVVKFAEYRDVIRILDRKNYIGYDYLVVNGEKEKYGYEFYDGTILNNDWYLLVDDYLCIK